jgi:hypothetical protein
MIPLIKLVLSLEKLIGGKIVEEKLIGGKID